MRVLEKDVDMLSVSYIGEPPQPRKFKIRFRDGSFRNDYPDHDNHWIDSTRYAWEDEIRFAEGPKIFT